MSGIELKDSLESREDFIRARICLAFRRPLIPWAQIHHRLGEEDADILILRVSLPDFAHCIRIGLVERRAILRLRIGITMTERLDQIALDRRRVLRRSPARVLVPSRPVPPPEARLLED